MLYQMFQGKRGHAFTFRYTFIDIFKEKTYPYHFFVIRCSFKDGELNGSFAIFAVKCWCFSWKEKYIKSNMISVFAAV